MWNAKRLRALALLTLLGTIFPSLPLVMAQDSPTLNEIVSRLERKNQQRLDALRAFEGTRHYRIAYEGPFGNRQAEMTVDVSYKSPDDKKFSVVSQTGSKFLFDHVLKGLLDGEKEAATGENQKKTALNTDNYNFSLMGTEDAAAGKQYVIGVSPKTDYKYLYKGKIWIDAGDYAVTRIDAEPSKSPSFWVKRSEVRHRYEKVEDFWLPQENRTESWIRLGGHALLSIDYQNYKITDRLPLAPLGNANGARNAGFGIQWNEQTALVLSGFQLK
jgi:outer membrane lipoprotein-sorting protein